MKKPTTRYVAVANLFGTLGYLSVLLQWSWAGLLLIYPLLVAQPEFLFPKPSPVQPEVMDPMPALTPLMVIIAAAVTIVILIITAITLVQLPKRIGKRGAALTHSAARSALPVLTHHKKITKKERQRLSYRLILLLKLGTVIIPIVAIIFIAPIDHITPIVIWTIMLFCAAWSLTYFAIQQVIAKLARLDTDMLW